MEMEPEIKTSKLQLCCKKFGLLILFIVFNLTDFVLDLDFCIVVNLLEKGLVYGPFEEALRYSLISFTILGTLFFLLEGYGLYYEIKYSKPRFYFYSETLSLISTWCDDVPHIVIALRVALCREEAITYVQYAKAFWEILHTMMKMTILIFCIQRFRKRGKTAKRVLNTLQLVGSVIILMCSITILVSIFHRRDPEGNFKFQLPKNLTGDIYDERVYFDNVSIFVHHRSFDFSPEEDKNYLRLTSIYDLQGSVDLQFKISHDVVTETKFIVWKYENSDYIAEHCFTIDRPSRLVQEEQANCSEFLSKNFSSEWIFSSHYVTRNPPYLIFGDIVYNALMKNESGDCAGVTFPGEYQVKYFRLKPTLAHKGHLLRSQSADQVQFFNKDTNLIEISEVWKTGIASCESSGYLEPQPDVNIQLVC